MSFIQNHLEKIDQYLNDHPRVKFLLPQAFLIIFVLSIISYFSFNASSNLSARGINTGFGFLSNKASFDIQFSLIEFDSSMTYGRAYLVGLLNTILVSVIGIIFATILGFIFGILRLSSNPLASGLATSYIEFFRNISLLLQIFFGILQYFVCYLRQKIRLFYLTLSMQISKVFIFQNLFGQI